MKQHLKQNQSLRHALSLSTSMKNSIELLKMNQNSLLEEFRNISLSNPLINFRCLDSCIPQFSSTGNSNAAFEFHSELNHVLNSKYITKNHHILLDLLDTKGFLPLPTSWYCQKLSVTSAELDSLIQDCKLCTPFGVFSKNSLDYIKMQLERDLNLLAIYLIENFPDEIKNKDLKIIANTLNLDISIIENEIALIRKCSLNPLQDYDDVNYNLIPDIQVNITDGHLHLEPYKYFEVYFDETISDKILKSDQLKPFLEEANFYIDSLNKRNTTLLIVANALFEVQKRFFLYDDELNVITLKKIAELTGFHISTVSRTVSSKNYVFQSKLYPLKSLLVSSTKQGSSKDSIKKAISTLVSLENKINPLTDDEIVIELKHFDLYASRRVISKYRKQIGILSSRSRKKDYLNKKVARCY